MVIVNESIGVIPGTSRDYSKETLEKSVIIRTKHLFNSVTLQYVNNQEGRRVQGENNETINQPECPTSDSKPSNGQLDHNNGENFGSEPPSDSSEIDKSEENGQTECVVHACRSLQSG